MSRDARQLNITPHISFIITRGAFDKAQEWEEIKDDPIARVDADPGIRGVHAYVSLIYLQFF